jgi:hypothetical protein
MEINNQAKNKMNNKKIINKKKVRKKVLNNPQLKKQLKVLLSKRKINLPKKQLKNLLMPQKLLVNQKNQTQQNKIIKKIKKRKIIFQGIYYYLI